MRKEKNALYNVINRLMQSGAVMISPLMRMMQWREQGECPASQFVPVRIQEGNEARFNIRKTTKDMFAIFETPFYYFVS